MRNFFIAAAIAVGVLLGNASDSAAGLETTLMKALDVIRGDNPSKEQRAQSASHLLAYCEGMNNRIPELTPREKAWVDAEIKAGRFISGLSRIEFAQYAAKNGLGSCVFYAAMLELVYKSEGNKDSSVVLYLWTALYAALTAPLLNSSIEMLGTSYPSMFTREEVKTTSALEIMMYTSILKGIIVPDLKRAAGMD